MLPERYKHALQALRDQAAAATMQLEDRTAGKPELADAQRRMSLHPLEVRHIVSVVRKARNVSIPELTEDRLAELLGYGS